MKRALCSIALCSIVSVAALALPWSARARELDVHYQPTPPEVVDAMLAIAKVGRGDKVYDLGCGDGRIVIEAARRFGARGIGIDLDPQRIKEAKANAKAAGVARRVEFKRADLFKTDIRSANVVMLYLLPELNLKLRPKLLHDLAPGTRIVSHMHDMGDWPPEQTVRIGHRTVYLWTVPARAVKRLPR